ncbi:MAG TPA: hypothetical protein VFO89_16935 [Thermoanaerobaculia bacterium]|nr:hypothetical protein [Thermoanaerobaculia bacterium]
MRSFAIAVLAILALAAPAPAAPLSGEAVVRTIAEDRVAVLIDSDHDQKIDRGFLLSTDLPVAKTNVYFAAAELEFTDAYVRLTSESRLFDFHVAGHPEPPAAPTGARVVRFIGYALQHSTGDGRCTLEQARNGDAGACYSYGEK